MPSMPETAFYVSNSTLQQSSLVKLPSTLLLLSERPPLTTRCSPSQVMQLFTFTCTVLTLSVNIPHLRLTISLLSEVRQG